MSLQERIPQALQQFTDSLGATLNQSHQQIMECIDNASKPEPIHMGAINLGDLVPDISIELAHVIALLQAAFEQIEQSRPTARQTDVAAWLLNDALQEAKRIYQNLYGVDPNRTEEV